MHKIKLILIILLLSSGISFGQTIGDTESITPEKAYIFIKTRNIQRLLKSFNYIIYHILGEEERDSIISQRDAFKDITGIDYLNEESLKSFGIDTGRSLSYAIFPQDTGREVIELFIPVKNGIAFTEKFIEIARRYIQEIEPHSVQYKDITVTELKEDMYVAFLNNYFVITSTDDCIKEIIDIHRERNRSLILNPKYKKYIAEGKNNFDVNIYISPAIANSINITQKDNIDDTTENTYDSELILNAVEYISAGFGIEDNTLKMKGALLFAEDNPYVDMILGLLKTGQNQKALDVNADSYIFISLNYKYLNNLCKSNAPFCETYNSFKKNIKDEGKIDFEKEILPYFSGMTNVFLIDSGSSIIGDIAIFLAIDDAQKSEELWKKFKNSVQGRYSKNKKFGEERIDGRNSFWYIDQNNIRYFVTFDKRGIYTGNNVNLIKNALKAKTFEKNNLQTSNVPLNDKTFFFMNIKKNPFLRNMLLMRSQDSAAIAPFLSKLKEMNIFCEKLDRHISIGIDIELKGN